ncbi:MAG: hypothetical protein KC619_31455 [Myxococcales bacterium]|nr:hypothetical protein [Myxococcales bacterium]
MTDSWPPSQRVSRFWKWFEEHLLEIEDWLDFDAARPGSPIPRMIGESLSEMHAGLRWEIGPSLNGDERFFAVSPGRREGLLPACKRIVEAAPVIPGWSFLPAKPPKAWGQRLVVRASGREHQFDFSDGWRYRASVSGSERIDVHVWPPANVVGSAPLEVVLGAVELALECQMGELFLVERVGAIDVDVQTRPPTNALIFPLDMGDRGRPL